MCTMAAGVDSMQSDNYALALIISPPPKDKM